MTDPNPVSDFAQCALMITTRNRYEDLNETLMKLIEFGLCDLPLYLVDDASDGLVADPQYLAKFSRLVLVRNKEAKGLVVNRNYMASIAKEKILISLDDDSCFVSRPNFKALHDYVVSDEKICGVEFDNFDNIHGEISNATEGQCLQMYTGFGHAIHRDRFLEVGGYREYLYHMCEERDFGQRAWKAGLVIKKYNKIRVIHRRTSVARLHDSNLFYLVRNTIFIKVANRGFFGLALAIPAALLMMTFWPHGKDRRHLVMIALGSSFLLILKHFREFRPLTAMEWIAFRRFPLR